MSSVVLRALLASLLTGCLVRTAPTSQPHASEKVFPVESAPDLAGRGDGVEHVRSRSRGTGAGLSISGPSRFEVIASYQHTFEDIPLLLAADRIMSSGTVLQLDGQRAWSDEGPTVVVGARPMRVRPQCASDDAEQLVSFETFIVARSSPKQLDYGRHVGLTERCAVRAMRSSRVKVPALVEGVLFAYQICTKETDCVSRNLVIVGPRPEFVASKGQFTPPDATVSNGSFSLVELPLVPGEASAATLNLNGQDLAAWRVLWGQPAPRNADMPMIASRRLSIRVESVWPIGDATPEISSTVSVDGVPSRNLATFLGVAPND